VSWNATKVGIDNIVIATSSSIKVLRYFSLKRGSYMKIRINPQYSMEYQNKQKEQSKPHYAHDGGRFDEVFERKVGKIDKERKNKSNSATR
jgi:hypothetical protein